MKKTIHHEQVMTTIQADAVCRMPDDSMKGSGLLAGDLAHISFDEDMTSGDLVAFTLCDLLALDVLQEHAGSFRKTMLQQHPETVLIRRLSLEPDRDLIALSPANAQQDYEPIVLLGEERNPLLLLGKVVGFTRSF